jgi:hypothetical protein
MPGNEAKRYSGAIRLVGLQFVLNLSRAEKLLRQPMEIVNREHRKELSDRVRENADAVTRLPDHVIAGWNSIAEGEAALFTRWFESSRADFEGRGPAK